MASPSYPDEITRKQFLANFFGSFPPQNPIQVSFNLTDKQREELAKASPFLWNSLDFGNSASVNPRYVNPNTNWGK